MTSKKRLCHFLMMTFSDMVYPNPYPSWESKGYPTQNPPRNRALLRGYYPPWSFDTKFFKKPLKLVASYKLPPRSWQKSPAFDQSWPVTSPGLHHSILPKLRWLVALGELNELHAAGSEFFFDMFFFTAVMNFLYLRIHLRRIKQCTCMIFFEWFDDLPLSWLFELEMQWSLCSNMFQKSQQELGCIQSWRID